MAQLSGNGIGGAGGVTVTKTVRIPHTFQISGLVGLPSGDTNYMAPFFISLPTGQTASISSIRHRINSGTSASFTVQRKPSGGALAAITGTLSATTTSTSSATTGAPVALADLDELSIIISAVSGTPYNMSVTIFVDYTV